MKYKSYNQDQMMLLPPSFQDLIASNSPVWLIVELINEKAEKILKQVRVKKIMQRIIRL